MVKVNLRVLSTIGSALELIAVTNPSIQNSFKKCDGLCWDNYKTLSKASFPIMG